jgi:hypothetical protein
VLQLRRLIESLFQLLLALAQAFASHCTAQGCS